MSVPLGFPTSEMILEIYPCWHAKKTGRKTLLPG